MAICILLTPFAMAEDQKNPAPASTKTPEPKQPSKSIRANDSSKKQTLPTKKKRRLQLDESVMVDGQRPGPGALFIESKDERMRRAMESLLIDATDGRGLSTHVSRPREFKAPPYQLISLSIQGMNQQETRTKLRNHLVTLASCWGEKKKSVRVEAKLKINEKGRVRRLNNLKVTPANASLRSCLEAHLRAFSFPAPAAGSGKVQFSIHFGRSETQKDSPAAPTKK